APNGTVYVAFTSDATNLVPNDTLDHRDVFVKNLTTGETVRASTNALGEEGRGDSFWPSLAVASDGTLHVAFVSTATNFVPGADTGSIHVYVKNLATGSIVLASSDSAGAPAPGSYYYHAAPAMAIAPDGTIYVAFSSDSDTLVPGDTNASWDVFLKNLATGQTQRVSTDSTLQQGIGNSYYPSIAINEAGVILVAFTSDADNFFVGDVNGSNDVFVKNVATGAILLADADAQGNPADGFARHGVIALAGDGTPYVAFISDAANLTPGVPNYHYEHVYVKNLGTGAVTLATATSAGVVASNYYLTEPISLAVAANGVVRVAFSTYAHDLVAGVAPHTNVYLKNLGDGGVDLISRRHPDLPQLLAGNSHDPVMSKDGRYVLFASYAPNLVPGDTNYPKTCSSATPFRGRRRASTPTPTATRT
ncbi:MAG: hypothetical protein NZ518_04840, partial [Dehalococcoidia bacterium]|nr:hypothetical protein [Dehalococcoidia bacterium]